jgi:hypothetical protein
MTVEEIYLKLKDELTADNESSSSPERIFIKNDEQTICTLGMNRSHEIIFVEFKPSPKDLADIEREGFVHPHPVEMLHDAGWRQAQITVWEEAEKLLEIIHRSYKKKRTRSTEEGAAGRLRRLAGGKAGKGRKPVIASRSLETPASAKRKAAAAAKSAKAQKSAAPVAKKPKPAAKPKAAAKSKTAAKAKPKARPAKKSKSSAGGKKKSSGKKRK